MTLATRLTDLVVAIGADIKSLQARLGLVENGAGSITATICVVNAATRLIQTQRIIASQVANQSAP